MVTRVNASTDVAGRRRETKPTARHDGEDHEAGDSRDSDYGPAVEVKLSRFSRSALAAMRGGVERAALTSVAAHGPSPALAGYLESAVGPLGRLWTRIALSRSDEPPESRN